MKKIQLLTLAMAVLVVDPAALLAQEQVTIVRRNSEHITGRFEDWVRQTDTVYVRVSPNDQRRIGMGDILVIDVGRDGKNLPAKEVQAAQGTEHILVTRRGDVMTGRLVNIEGGEGSAQPNEPRSVTFRGNIEQRLRLATIDRISGLFC